MRLGRHAIAFCAALLITPFGAAGALTSVESAPAASGDTPAGSSAIRFEENAGQTDPRARFIVRASGWTVFLNGSEALYAHDGAMVGMRLQSGDPWAEVAPGRQLPGFSNYFVGNDPAKWRSGVRSFDGVRFDGVLPGVDLRYHQAGGSLEYDFIVAPGTDPRCITWTLEGFDSVTIDPSGDLVIETGAGALRQRAPVVYQEQANGRSRIGGGFELTGFDTVSFELGEYDRDLPLVIDPEVAFCTYLGGANGHEFYPKLTVARNGGIVVGNLTNSAAYPVEGEISGYRGDFDIVVTRYAPSGAGFVFSTYLGSTAYDEFWGLALDATGNVFVAGTTQGADFPTVNAHQTALAGPSDSIVARLNSSGSALAFSTYVGGTRTERFLGIAAGPAGDVYVAGSSSSADFPLKNALQATLRGTEDGIVMRFSSTGVLKASTYHGGSMIDRITDVDVGLDGSVYVTGLATSTDFPVVGPVQPANGGSIDSFATKFDSDLSAILYGTYIGGTDFDTANAIAVDSDGFAVVAGSTRSTDFPTRNALQTALAGNADMFLVRLDPAGSEFTISTYIGTTGGETIRGLAVVPGYVYACGTVDSPTFPVIDPLPGWPLTPVAGDGFVMKLALSPPAIVFSSLLGGSGLEEEAGIAIDHRSVLAVAFSTWSADVPVQNALQPAIAPVGLDMFVLKLIDPMPPDLLAANKLVSAGKPYRIKLTGINMQPGLTVTIGSDTTPWPAVKVKNEATIILKGAGLKQRFPKGVPVAIRVANPEGGSDVIEFTR